ANPQAALQFLELQQTALEIQVHLGPDAGAHLQSLLLSERPGKGYRSGIVEEGLGFRFGDRGEDESVSFAGETQLLDRKPLILPAELDVPEPVSPLEPGSGGISETARGVSR